MFAFLINNKLNYLVVFILALSFFSFFQSSSVMPDPDGFYHAKVAQLISDQGIIKDFPWLQETFLRENYIDHHFLYHLSLIPFVNFIDPLLGVKFAQALFSAFFIFIFYWFLRQENAKYPIFWIFILLGNSPFLFRLSLVKANAFSLIFLILGLYFIFRRKYLWLFVLSYFYVLSYGGWPLLLILTIVFLFVDWLKRKYDSRNFFKRIWLKINFLKLYKKKFANQQKESLKLFSACFLGLFLGVVVNPYFPKNLYFYFEQIIQIGIINYGDKINVGGEWYAYNFLDLFLDSRVVFIFFVLGLILFFVSFKKQNSKNISLFLISLFFLIATLKSRRYVEYFIPFTILFSALAFSRSFKEKKVRDFYFWLQGKKIKITTFIVTIFFIFCPGIISLKDVYRTKNDLVYGSNLDLYKGASEFIKNNSLEGEIVFHADWDDFPALFYHNTHNYFLVGLDPTFMYNYNADLYNEWAGITTGEDNIDLYSKIRNDFNASFIFLDFEHLNFNENLIIDKNFELIYSDKEAKVYKVKR